MLELSVDDWYHGMDVYFLNVVCPTRLVTPIMQAQQSGVIINISTFVAFFVSKFSRILKQRSQPIMVRRDSQPLGRQKIAIRLQVPISKVRSTSLDYDNDIQSQASNNLFETHFAC